MLNAQGEVEMNLKLEDRLRADQAELVQALAAAVIAQVKLKDHPVGKVWECQECGEWSSARYVGRYVSAHKKECLTGRAMLELVRRERAGYKPTGVPAC